MQAMTFDALVAKAMITAGESRIVRVVAVGADGHIMPLRELLPYDWRR